MSFSEKMNKLKLLFNPFNIFKPSPVAQKILDDLDRYPLNDWDWAYTCHYYANPSLSYKIYLNYSYGYQVVGLKLGYFDQKRLDSKCKKQIEEAEKLAEEMESMEVVEKIMKS